MVGWPGSGLNWQGSAFCFKLCQVLVSIIESSYLASFNSEIKIMPYRYKNVWELLKKKELLIRNCEKTEHWSGSGLGLLVGAILHCSFQFSSNLRKFHIIEQDVKSLPRDWVVTPTPSSQPVIHNFIPAFCTISTILLINCSKLIKAHVQNKAKLLPLCTSLVD